MANFTGQLNTNEVISALYNMIISIHTYADNIATDIHGSLYESMKVDGSMYGDTKLFISTDIQKTNPWRNDAEAANLLQLHRPVAPKIQAIKLDQFRYVAITIDNYLTKRAFSDEGSFSQFNSVVLGWLRDSKKVFSTKYFNVKAGTEVGATAAQSVEVKASDAQTLGQAVGLKIADLLVELKDASRDYNDNGAMRSYDESDIIILWNAKYLNQITKLDMPVLFHNDALIAKFGQYVIPARYFGTVNTGTKAAGTGVRSLVEKDMGSTHVFPGELVPTGQTAAAGESYTVDDNVICKIMTREALPVMSSFETSTAFNNPLSLTETNYLIWGFNTIEHLKDKPYITVKLSA